MPAVMKPPDAFLNRISSREEQRSIRGDESRAREEQESQRSFLQTAPVITATAAATTAGDLWLLQLGWFAREELLASVELD